jgi:2'-5' RNA ligase
MPQFTRTFVAVPIPVDKSDKLGRLQALVAPEISTARWGNPKDLHLTLAFLGDVANTDLNAVCHTVEDAVRGFEPFELRIEGFGAFPNSARPRIFWAGLVGPGLHALRAIQQAVGKAVGRAGYPPADDRFSPHVTLGRLRSGRGRVPDVSNLVEKHARWTAGSFSVAEIMTYSSDFGAKRTSEGPCYTALATARLAGENRPARA